MISIETNAKTDSFDRYHRYLYDNDNLNTKYIDPHTSLNSKTKGETTLGRPYYQTMRNTQNIGEWNAEKRRRYTRFNPSSYYCNSKFE
jgi:hypothetical protein